VTKLRGFVTLKINLNRNNYNNNYTVFVKNVKKYVSVDIQKETKFIQDLLESPNRMLLQYLPASQFFTYFLYNSDTYKRVSW